MLRHLKKLVIGIVASLLLVIGSTSAFASGGVSLFQYSPSYSVNGYVSNYQYDWKTSYVSWGVYYETDYKVIAYSSWASSPQTWSNGVAVNVSNVTTPGTLSYGIIVQGTNDGSNWSNLCEWDNVNTTGNYSGGFSGSYSQIRLVIFSENGSNNYSLNGTLTTQLYSVAADQQTAQTAATNATNAMNAANSANTAAQAAQTAATNAANGTNTIINSYLSTAAGVVQDSSGTVLTASRAAQLAASNADTDIKSAQNALTNQLNNVQSSVSNIQTSVQNITNYLPPTLNKVSGYNGATATSSTSFKVTLDYNNATDYQYQIDGGSWSGWTSLTGYNGYVTVSGLSTSGMHTITVKVRNGSGGPTAQGSMTVFKL